MGIHQPTGGYGAIELHAHGPVTQFRALTLREKGGKAGCISRCPVYCEDRPGAKQEAEINQ